MTEEEKEKKEKEKQKNLDNLEQEINEQSKDDMDIDIDWLIDKILMYSEKQADIELYPYQKEFARRIIESIVLNDGEEITALFSRQSGNYI